MITEMNLFFHPSSIAVIGNSNRKGGYQIIRNLLYGYDGAIYPVNPNYTEIQGIPCFPSLEDIPGQVDLAIIFVPAPAVPSVLEACALKDITRVMIESAGYAEVGDKGKAIQDQCKAIAKEAGIRIWGPNCMGLVDIRNKYFFTFMSPFIYEDGLIPGKISIIAQSGMLSAAFLADLMSQRTIGISKVCSIGNKADVVFSLAPLKRSVALKLIRNIKGKKLLEGFRGRSPLNHELMAELLVNLANWVALILRSNK